MLFTDNFEKKKYPTLDMASILKVTSAVGARALKPSFKSTKYVKGKLKYLSKDCTKKMTRMHFSRLIWPRKMKIKEMRKLRSLGRKGSCPTAAPSLENQALLLPLLLSMP